MTIIRFFTKMGVLREILCEKRVFYVAKIPRQVHKKKQLKNDHLL